MTRLPMFPLGTVLVPTAVLPLHIFEPRYRALMDDLTGAELGTPLIDPEFGVVLIERGHEVGGGEVRGRLGTAARLLDAQRLPDGHWVVAAVGTDRVRVVEWLSDDPYPIAEVERLDEAAWEPADAEGLGLAEAAIRRALALAVELGEDDAGASIELAEDPRTASWQCCALAPVGPFDRYRILAAADVAARLALVASLTDEVAEMLALRRAGG